MRYRKTKHYQNKYNYFKNLHIEEFKRKIVAPKICIFRAGFHFRFKKMISFTYILWPKNCLNISIEGDFALILYGVPKNSQKITSSNNISLSTRRQIIPGQTSVESWRQRTDSLKWWYYYTLPHIISYHNRKERVSDISHDNIFMGFQTETMRLCSVGQCKMVVLFVYIVQHRIFEHILVSISCCCVLNRWYKHLPSFFQQTWFSCSEEETKGKIN